MSGEILTAKEIFNEVKEGLTVTLTVGAARADIADDQEKLGQLQSALELAIPLYEFLGDGNIVVGSVRDVMGDEWKPSGEWAEYLDAVAKL